MRSRSEIRERLHSVKQGAVGLGEIAALEWVLDPAEPVWSESPGVEKECLDTFNRLVKFLLPGVLIRRLSSETDKKTTHDLEMLAAGIAAEFQAISERLKRLENQ